MIEVLCSPGTAPLMSKTRPLLTVIPPNSPAGASLCARTQILGFFPGCHLPVGF